MAPLGVVFAPISTHPSRPRRRHSAMRHYPGQSRRLSVTTRRARRPGVPSLAPPRGVGADDHIGPLLGTTCVASVGRGDYTPPSQIPSRNLAGGSHTPGAPRRPGRISLLRSPVGGGLRPAPLGKVPFLHRLPLFRKASTPRRGGPMCPPGHVSARDPPRADTQVGPYKTSINPWTPGGDGAPPLQKNTGYLPGPVFPVHFQSSILNFSFSISQKTPAPALRRGRGVFSGRGRRASCLPGSSPRW